MDNYAMTIDVNAAYIYNIMYNTKFVICTVYGNSDSYHHVNTYVIIVKIKP